MDFMEAYEAELEAKAKADDIIYFSPEQVIKRNARRAEEFAAGVRNGWHDEEGNSLLPEDDEEEDEE